MPGFGGTLLKFAAAFVFPVAEHNDNPFTLNDGDQAPFQLDSSGNLCVSIPLGLNVGQGPAGASSQGWFIRVMDSTTNGPAKIAATSVASAFADPALVVDVRPGGVLPAAAFASDAETNSISSTIVRNRNHAYNGTSWDRIRAGLSGVQTALTGILNTIGMAQYNTAAPTPANGNVVPLQADASGNLKSVEMGGGLYPVGAAAADAVTNPTITKVGAYNIGFNGTSWDRIRTGLVAVQTTFVGLLNTLPLGRYNATPPTLADGNSVVVQLDANGNLKIAEQFAAGFEDNALGLAKTVVVPTASATYAPNLHANFGAATKANLKGTQGNVFGFVVTNVNVGLRYFQIHNKATAPAGGDVPAISIPLGAGTATVPTILKIGSETLTENGVNLTTGIGWAISTTIATFTDSATAADHSVHVTWK